MVGGAFGLLRTRFFGVPYPGKRPAPFLRLVDKRFYSGAERLGIRQCQRERAYEGVGTGFGVLANAAISSLYSMPFSFLRYLRSFSPIMISLPKFPSSGSNM